MAGRKLRVDVWSDIACPWCYVGKRRLEAALADFPQRDSVEVVWRSFELDPEATRVAEPNVSYVRRLARKYGCSMEDGERMIARMTEVARADGLDFHFERIQPGNTFDAHRVLHLAGARAKQDAVKERFLHGYLNEGVAIGAPQEVVRMAGEAGLDPSEVEEVLATDKYASEVRADEEEAHEVSIRGVPFFLFAGRYAVSGAQPAELLLGALTRVWSEIDVKPVMLADGAVCGPEGCA